MLALVDCNNFYVSCERAFQPQLENQPVIVLSSNDGCVVSASAEVKGWGVHIGQPLFQLKQLVAKHQIKIFSSNFPLYGDMSARVMSLLRHYAKEMEIYSIDEAFLDLSALSRQTLIPYAQEIIGAVKRGTGIPITIGLAPTKTLAKVANYIAKKGGANTGWVYVLDSLEKTQRMLKQISVEQVWGIGRESAMKLKKDQIHTAADLANADLSWLRKRFNIVLERIARELQGQQCFAVESFPRTRKQIMVSRSFGAPQAQYPVLRSALSHFIARAAEKLRDEGLVCRQMTVFVKFKAAIAGERSHYESEAICLPHATDNTAELLSVGLSQLIKMVYPGRQYQKTGVILDDFLPAHIRQSNLFVLPQQQQKGEQLMLALDRVNKKFGTNSLQYACQGLSTSWAPKKDRQSPSYTTVWSQLLTVKAN